MADYNIDIVVDPSKAVKGSRQAINSLGKVESSADKLRNTLRRSFAFSGVAVLVQQVVQLTDAYTNLQNRLRVVTNGQMELTAATEELFQISRRTRSSFEGTVELYSRVSLAARGMGLTMRDVTEFTESMNKAIILSGASGREANAGLIQLSQGIASGALRGDELRSVLEQLPVVADVIAKQLKVTRGELRKLGETGQITSEQIIKAFKNSREELSERFAKTIPTISQSFQVLRNSLVRIVGSFNNTNGAAQTLSRTLLALADNMENVLRVGLALVITLGTILATKVIPFLLTQIYLLTAAIAANPLGALLVALTAGISLLLAFGDKITVETGKLTKFSDVASAAWDKMRETGGVFLKWYLENFGGVGEKTVEVFKEAEFSVAGFLRFTAQAMDEFVGIFTAAIRVVEVIWGASFNNLTALMAPALNESVRLMEKGVNKIISGVNKIFIATKSARRIALIELGRIESDGVTSVKDLGTALSNALKEGMNFSFFRDEIDGVLRDAEKLAKIREKEEKAKISDKLLGDARKAASARDKAFALIVKGLNMEIGLLKLATKEREVMIKVLAIEKKLKGELGFEEFGLIQSKLQDIQLLKTQAELYTKIKAPVEEYKDTLAGLNALLERGIINQQELSASMQQTALATGLGGLQSELFPEEGEQNALQDQLMQRNLLIQQSREAGLLSELEYNRLSEEAQRQHAQSLTDIETNKAAMIARIGASGFNSLLQLTKHFAGEQSNTYKALFAVTKAFALADMTIQIAAATAKALNTPWPANLAAIAQVAAAGAGLVSTVTNAQYAGGFRTGGDFKVGGSGAPDSQMVAFRATPGEQVSIRTPSQVKSEQSGSPVGGQVIEQTIINTINPDTLIESTSDDVFVNKMERNQEAIRNIVRL